MVVYTAIVIVYGQVISMYCMYMAINNLARSAEDDEALSGPRKLGLEVF